MSLQIIIKESQRDRENRHRELSHRVRGVAGNTYTAARTADEANDIVYHELRDREDAKPIIVEGGKEVRLAAESDAHRLHLLTGVDEGRIRQSEGIDK